MPELDELAKAVMLSEPLLTTILEWRLSAAMLTWRLAAMFPGRVAAILSVSKGIKMPAIRKSLILLSICIWLEGTRP